MKKLLFVLAFAFIGGQAFSQMYIVAVSSFHASHPQYGNCNINSLSYDRIMTTIDPQGNVTYQCLPYNAGSRLDQGGGNLVLINQEFNSILSQGYKLVTPSTNINLHGTEDNGLWYFVIPWTSSGLEEVPTTLNNLNISPNPANEFVNISLSYDLKGESEIVFISEAGYVYHKESVASISKNETYNIDISRIPAGKYLVTIKNGKTYTTPQKLIIL